MSAPVQYVGSQVYEGFLIAIAQDEEGYKFTFTDADELLAFSPGFFTFETALQAAIEQVQEVLVWASTN